MVQTAPYLVPHPNIKNCGPAFPPLFNLFSPLGAKGTSIYIIIIIIINISRVTAVTFKYRIYSYI